MAKLSKTIAVYKYFIILFVSLVMVLPFKHFTMFIMTLIVKPTKTQIII